jgi:hypothetical protein
MNVVGKTYTVTYDEPATALVFRGVLRLQNFEEGESIIRLLDQVAEQAPKTIQFGH